MRQKHIPAPTTFLTALLFVLALQHNTYGLSENETRLLQELMSLHKAGRELIVTSHCHIDFSITYRDAKGEIRVQSCRGEHWRSRDAVRLKVQEGAKAVDLVWEGSIRKSLTSISEKDTPLYGAVVGAHASPYTHRGDAWIRGLLVVHPPEQLSNYAKVL